MTTILRIGIWNQFWPESFYTDFPTVGLIPPFAEHYARDFGGATIGIGIVLAAAAIIPRTILVVPALLAVSAFGIPHFFFHLGHLVGATPAEVVFLVVSTGLAAWLPALLLVLAVVRWRRETRSPEAVAG